MSINLHDIVRGAINIVNPDEDVWLIQNISQTNVKGRITAVYAEPEKVRAQVQTLSGDDLTVMNDTERTERDRKFYLYSDTETGTPPSGIIRPLGKSGDFMQKNVPIELAKLWYPSPDSVAKAIKIGRASCRERV